MRRDASFWVRHAGLRFVLATSLAATLVLTGASSVLAQPMGDIEVKPQSVGLGYSNLREAMDTKMQRQLRAAIRELDLDDAIDDKQLSA
ncbi:MAG: hypothetical protein ACRESW_00500, partial [Nevskiales bacterium]